MCIRDSGRVVFVGNSYPAGVFATHLLGPFYINDTAARIAVFRDDLNYHILKQLNDGYLNVTEFVKTGANTLEALKALPKLRPFYEMCIRDSPFGVKTMHRMLKNRAYIGEYRHGVLREVPPRGLRQPGDAR